MINYLLRETISQEKLRLGKLIADKDYAGYIRLFEYYDRRDEFIKDLQDMVDYLAKFNYMQAVLWSHFKGVE